MNSLVKIGVAFIASLFMYGCSTTFPSPISGCLRRPYIRVTVQGSMPVSAVYRNNFYVLGTNGDVQARTFFTPEIVAEIISGVLDSASTVAVNTSENYYGTLKSTYRWRTDVLISGFTNLSEKQIYIILKQATRPQVDAQRPPIIAKDE